MATWLKIAIALVSFFALFVLGVLGVNWIVLSSGPILDSLKALAPADAVLVPGALVYSSGRVSDVVEDRILAAFEVYKAGLVKKILISGDHGTRYYDEVNAMKRVFLGLGAAPEDLFTDHAGFSTYESLYRARDVFGVRSLIIASQAFHLPRCLYIAHGLGIEAQAFVADRRKYVDEAKNDAREFLARVKAFLDVAVFRPPPAILGPPIPISGNGRKSWDQ